MKFVHCADVHIGSPFSSEGLEESKLRRKSLCDAFSALIRETKSYKADILLIAGDLFENSYVSAEEIRFVIDELASLAPCRVFISPGNHDPYCDLSPYKTAVFPDNVHIFSRESISCVVLEELGACVYGYAFCSAQSTLKPLAGFSHDAGSMVGILVAHAETVAGSKYASITREEIQASRLDYIALGHIHDNDILHTEGKTSYMFSGCLEGRSFKECERKGAVFGEISNGEIYCEKRILSGRYYKILQLDCTGKNSVAELTEYIAGECAEFDSDCALRLVLNGNIDSSLDINEEDLRVALPKPFLLEVVNNTRPTFDFAVLESDRGIKGAFFEKLKPMLYSDDEREKRVAELALKYTLMAFDASKKR